MRLVFPLRAVLRCGIALLGAWLALPAAADVSASQRRAGEEYLAAVAAGDTQAMALAIHEQELELLRSRLLDEMRLEADRNGNLVRSRLFGAGMPLAQIERLTPQNFFVQLAARLRFGARPFERIDWLDAVKDEGGAVQLVGRARPPKEQGSIRVPVLVTLVPWGKDWKAALPLELQAQIDDLRTGRRSAAAAAPAASAAPDPSARAEAPASPQAILDLFKAAEENLGARRCEEYYQRQMSPNFRRTTAAKALRALIASCESRTETRESLLTALQFARETAPRFEYAGTRAVYDLRGKGLPFPQLVVELVDKRWYIAE
ncbi:MAG: hypothetical protein QM696_00515 [Steroidobacteraceae bacterium]